MAITDQCPSSLETQRLEILKKYEILDTPPERSFDGITQLASQLLKTPIALLSLVDQDRIWFKSRVGMELGQVERISGFCSLVIESNEPLLIEDALIDERSMQLKTVTGQMGVRFYLGVPLRTREGVNIGALSVIDQQPRISKQSDGDILKSLADLVIAQMELRLENRLAVRKQHQILNTTAHDLKNPLSIMPLLADMIMENKHNPKAIDDISRQIKDAGQRMARTIHDLLENAIRDTSDLQLRLRPVELHSLVKGVVEANRALAKKKGQHLHLKVLDKCTIFGDHGKLTEIVDNLVNNAIKYSEKEKRIEVLVRCREQNAVLEVRDQGQGLTRDDRKNLFRRFTTLSARPTGGEESTGLGLFIVKNLVEAHNGTIRAYSEGQGSGSRFVAEFPLSQD